MATKKKKLLSAPNTIKYETFLDSLELIAIGIKACSCNLDRLGYMQFRQNTKRPVRILEEEAKVTSLKDNHFDAEIRFSIRLASESQATPDASLSVECIFEAHFHTGADPADRAHVEKFAQSELRFLLLPYARHFVTDMTARMAIGPIVLPIQTK